MNTDIQAAVAHLVETHRDDIEASAQFSTNCVKCVHDSRDAFQHLFDVRLAESGSLGSFRAGYFPEQGYDYLLGCCVTFAQRNAGVNPDKDVRKFINEQGSGIFKGIIDLYGVCRNPQWTNKQKLVVVRIDVDSQSGVVKVSLVSEEYFVALVKALVAHLTATTPADACDYLGNPFALCTKIIDMFAELTDKRTTDAYVLYFRTKNFNRVIHYPQFVQLVRMMHGSITKLVTLPPTLVAALKRFAPSESGASKPRKAAGAAKSEIVVDRGSINSRVARQYDLLVFKPEAMTRPGVYLEIAKAAADGCGFAMKNPKREVYRAIGAARVRSLVEERVPIKDLPDLEDLYKSLMLQYCPKTDDSVETSKCVQMLREWCLVEVGLFDLVFTEFARIDALIEAYMVVYQRPRQVWSGWAPDSREFSEMVLGAITAPPLLPLTDADAKPDFVAEDWMRLLGVILQHVGGECRSLDTVHHALALASHQVLRVVPCDIMECVSYFATYYGYYTDVLDGIIREIGTSGYNVDYAGIPGFLEDSLEIPDDWELFGTVERGESGVGTAMEAEAPVGVRRSDRGIRPVDRFRAEPGTGRPAGNETGSAEAEAVPLQSFDADEEGDLMADEEDGLMADD